MEFLTGRDMYGRKRDFRQWLSDYVIMHIPIPLQTVAPKAFEWMGSTDPARIRKDFNLIDGALRTIGIPTHKYRSKAEQVMLDHFMEYRVDRPARSDLPRLQEARRRVLKHMRDGDVEGAKAVVTKFSKDVKIEPFRMVQWIEEAAYPENVASFKNLPLSKMAEVLTVATPDEEKMFLPFFAEKLSKLDLEKQMEEFKLATPFITEYVKKFQKQQGRRAVNE
jgi:ribosomal protein S15P/S13E